MQSRVTIRAARHNVEGYPLTDFHQTSYSLPDDQSP